MTIPEKPAHPKALAIQRPRKLEKQLQKNEEDYHKYMYALKLRTDAGDLEVKETGRSAEEYEGGYKLEEYGGPHKLNVRTFSGDVEVHFGN